MIDSYKKLLDMLEPYERRRLLVLLAIMVAMALAELAGISTLMILLRVLSDPQAAIDDTVLGSVYDWLGLTSIFAFQVVLALATLTAVVSSILVRAGGTYAMIRFSKMRGYTVSSRLLEAYLHQPYTWFLQRNSAEISRNVLQEAEGLVNRVMIPGLQMVAYGMLAASLVGFMLVFNPTVTLVAAGIIAGLYFLIFRALKDLLRDLGEGIADANHERFKLTNESAGGFKEIKLMHLEQYYTHRYQRPARSKARKEALAMVIQETPRFVLESIAFAAILAGILVFLVRTDGNLLAAIPTLGVFAFAALRMMPSAQMIYRSSTAMQNAKPVLEAIHANYMEARATQAKMDIKGHGGRKLALDKELALRDISFTYPSSDEPTLSHFSLSIGARTTIGLVGGTGAGKTTVVDLILGLLSPQNGEMIVDGQRIDNENLQAWQRTIGYVPQTIYLVDDTVAANIAFGVPKDQIDMAAVERAARTASLHDFVMTELPDGYSSIVGERGIRLSGGQRQRIGIARALYRAPELLIMDEATSALDNITERAVMDAIQQLRDDITIIMIAHRLSTVRKCDQIYLLNRGVVESSGTYEELVDRNEIFREMAANG
ncbi:MAG: ABC transporter ATP-binding protein [Pseudomonadota bacterium]